MTNDTNTQNELLRKQAWDYFQLHSGQRLTTFNFYIVIASVITTALFSTFQKDYKAPLLGIPLGLLLSFISYIFWRVDSRNRQLIKGAEDALKYFEGTSQLPDQDGEPHVAKIFQHEEYATNFRKGYRSILPWKNHQSYSKSFNRVFFAFAFVGVIGAAIASMRLF